MPMRDSLIISVDTPGPLAAIDQLWRMVRRQSLVFWTAALVVTAAAAGYTLSLTPRYMAIASISVVTAPPDPLQGGRDENAGLREDDTATQATLVTSRDLVMSVVEQLGLGVAPPGSPSLPQIVCTWGSAVKAIQTRCLPTPAPSIDQRVGGVMSRLKAVPVPRTRVIDLSYIDNDPEIAANTLNALVAAFQADQLKERSAVLARSVAWISSRADQLKRDWLSAEARASAFRASSNLTSGTSRDSSSEPLILRQVASAASSLSAAQADLTSAEARQGALKAALDASDRMALLNMREEPTLVALAGQLNALRAQAADLRSKYSNSFPGLIAINSQVAAIEGQIRSESVRALRALDLDVSIKRSALNELASSLAKLRQTADQQGSKQTQLSTLDDEAHSARIAYETFLSRATALDDRTSLLTPPIQFTAHARVPEGPYFPQTRNFLLASVVLGALSGVFAALVRDLLMPGFSNVSSIGRQLAVPLLGTIPKISLWGSRRKTARYVSDKPYSVASEVMRGLVAQLGMMSDDKQPARSVVVASATGREGKTTASIWLASAAGNGGQRVLLIDGDHRRGQINHLLDGDHPVGLTDVLFNNVLVDDVIQHAPSRNIDFIGAGQPRATSFGSREVERLRASLRLLEQRYDLIIIDTPPLLVLTDALVYASVVDRVVFLCRWKRTSRRAVISCLEKLRYAHANVQGVVVSMFNYGKLPKFSDEYTSSDLKVMRRYYLG